MRLGLLPAGRLAVSGIASRGVAVGPCRESVAASRLPPEVVRPECDRGDRRRVAEQIEVAAPDIPGVPEAPERPHEIQIVPLKGLPVVAILVVMLILSISQNWKWGIAFFHVAGGGIWTAVDLFVGLVIGPILGGLSIPARMEFSARFMPKMVLVMPTVVLLTLAAGFQLAIQLGNLSSGNPNHIWLMASFGVVGVMAAIALGVLEPANIAVLFELRKPRPDGELIGKLMRRFVYSAGILGAMQVATLVIMTRVATQ